MAGTKRSACTARCTLGALALIASSAVADSTLVDPAAAAWRALTTHDVETAHALLADNHPAAVPEVGDKAFVGTLAAAYAHALERAKTVTDYPGYVATLGELANAMGDGHIWSRPRYQQAGLQWAGMEFRPASIEWAGLIAARRGSDWVIAKEDPAVAGEALVGAQLIDCGGTPVADFARETLGRYRVVWSVDAMQVLAAPWLLVDEGNPFVSRPGSCTIRTAGGTRTLALNWKRVSREKFVGMIADVHGKAGFGVRFVDPGYWISMESLSAQAQAVIDDAKAQAATLRAAPFVVIDLRGNAGGGDSYGRALADVLYGSAYTGAVLGPAEEEGACPEVWRASAENISADEAFAKKFAAAGETVGAKAYEEAAAAMRTALDEHRALTGRPVCPSPKRAGPRHARSLMRGHVIVLTDSACFSSCINVVGFFRKLGATQVGQTTGADTHYAEVREIVLPSGLSTFSTLQAIEPDQPPHIGPYAPAVPYGSDIGATAALEHWIAQTVVPGLHTARLDGVSPPSRSEL